MDWHTVKDMNRRFGDLINDYRMLLDKRSVYDDLVEDFDILKNKVLENGFVPDDIERFKKNYNRFCELLEGDLSKAAEMFNLYRNLKEGFSQMSASQDFPKGLIEIFEEELPSYLDLVKKVARGRLTDFEKVIRIFDSRDGI